MSVCVPVGVRVCAGAWELGGTGSGFHLSHADTQAQAPTKYSLVDTRTHAKQRGQFRGWDARSPAGHAITHMGVTCSDPNPTPGGVSDP